MPASQEALLRSVAEVGRGHVAELRTFVRVEEAGLDDRPAHSAVADARGIPFVLVQPPVLVAEGDVDRHLGHDDRAVSARIEQHQTHFGERRRGAGHHGP